MKLSKASVKSRYYIIYLTISLDTRKMYIGQHLVKAKRSEKDGYLGSGTLLKREIDKYGSKRFVRKILHRVTTAREANKLERQEIKAYNTRNPVIGYNVASGGQDSHMTRERRARAWRTRRKQGTTFAWDKGAKGLQQLRFSGRVIRRNNTNNKKNRGRNDRQIN